MNKQSTLLMATEITSQAAFVGRHSL